MKLLDVLSALAAVIPKARAPLSEETLERLRWIAEVNARAAARRAEHERMVDELLGGEGRWIPRRRGWFASRRESMEQGAAERGRERRET